jgi:murein DD-endopeptidase MepM/ murein hydrolase activator NlpD
MRKSPMHGEWEGHAGIDYAAPTGTPIHATADGVVEVAGWRSGYGNTVIIKHRGKISTLYGHQSRLAEGITAGTRVTQGQLIGYVGSTGWSTGAHLHYEFRINDKPVDPLSVAMPESQPIEPAMRDAFALATSAYRQQLQVLASFQDNVPDVSNVASR